MICKLLRQIIAFGQKVKTQQQQNTIFKQKETLPEPEIEPWTSCTPKRMRYHCTTQSTDSIDRSQAIKLFLRNGSKRKKTKPYLLARHFQQIHFFCNILHA